MMRFRVSFTIPSQLLSTVVSVLTDEVQNLSIEQCESGRSARVEPPRTRLSPPRASVRKRAPLQELVEQILRDSGRVMTLDEIGDMVEAAGFAHTSASPALSDLRKRGIAERVGPSQYRLVPRNPVEAQS